MESFDVLVFFFPIQGKGRGAVEEYDGWKGMYVTLIYIAFLICMAWIYMLERL